MTTTGERCDECGGVGEHDLDCSRLPFVFENVLTGERTMLQGDEPEARGPRTTHPARVMHTAMDDVVSDVVYAASDYHSRFGDYRHSPDYEQMCARVAATIHAYVEKRDAAWRAAFGDAIAAPKNEVFVNHEWDDEPSDNRYADEEEEGP